MGRNDELVSGARVGNESAAVRVRFVSTPTRAENPSYTTGPRGRGKPFVRNSERNWEKQVTSRRRNYRKPELTVDRVLIFPAVRRCLQMNERLRKRRQTDAHTQYEHLP